MSPQIATFIKGLNFDNHSNYNDLIKSLEKISKLSLDTTIFPGHGEKTSLNEEINYFDLY